MSGLADLLELSIGNGLVDLLELSTGSETAP